MRRRPDSQSSDTQTTQDRSPGQTAASADRQGFGRLNLKIAHVLTGGLVLSIGLLLTGGVLALTAEGASVSEATSVADIPRAIGSLEPGGFLGLGLLVLLATPVARVIALGLGFARRREWALFATCVLVLALLALSASLGLVG